MTATPSPCNRVCTLDRASGLCLGCGRSAAEIGAWTTMTEPERAALVAKLPARLAALAARGLQAAPRPPRPRDAG